MMDLTPAELAQADQCLAMANNLLDEALEMSRHRPDETTVVDHFLGLGSALNGIGKYHAIMIAAAAVMRLEAECAKT